MNWSITKKHKFVVILIITSITILLSSTGISVGSSNANDIQINATLQQKINKELQTQIKQNSSEQIPVLIQLKKEEDIEKIEKLIKDNGGVVIGKFKVGDIIAATISADKIGEVAKDNSIKKAWPNRIYHALLDKSVPQINAPVMWDNEYNGSGIKIAILDTGIDKTHPMLQGKVILEKVFTGENHAYDIKGHGTHVAGIAAGRKVSSDSYNGVAPDALLINAKVLNDTGSGNDIGIINAINWAIDPDGNPGTDDGADVISMSLGGPYSDIDSPLLSAIKDAADAGVIVVVASGNCGPDAPSADCGGYIGVTTPGISPDAITVGAVDDFNNIASFSSGGYVNGFIKPDVVAPGVNINSSQPGGSYASWSGTSMATPHVAGAVALLLQSNHNLNPEQVKYILEYTGVHLGEPGKDIKYGSGLINASKFVPSNVDKLLKYRLEFPEAIARGAKLNIIVNTTSDNVVDINATIIDPKKNTYLVNFTNTTAHLWNTSFINTSEYGEYSLNISILDKEGNITEFNEQFSVIKNSGFFPNGTINEIIMPEKIAYNEKLPIQVVFENTGESSIEVMIEAQIIDGNKLISSIETEQKVVDSKTITLFNLNWTANFSLGQKKLKALAIYEGHANIKEKNFTIFDNTTPIISNISSSNSLYFKNNPVLIKVEIKDLSDISGNITVVNPSGVSKIIDLRNIMKINDISTLVGTYADTTYIGEYTFNAIVCDSAGYCTNSNQYSFNVSDCSNPSILVVSEQEGSNPERFEKVLNNSYCINIWDNSKSGNPELSYLERFGLVIWSTGNYWGKNIDYNSSSLLTDYTMNGGKLVLEGPDIAFNHGYDDFMKNVTHSKILEDLYLSDDQNNISINITRNNPIFKGMPNNITYNVSLSPYPDSIIPVNNGIELAKWSINGSAIIAYNDPVRSGSRTLMIPFMMNALGSSENIFIENIVSWILTDENNADLVVGKITHDYLITGMNTINIEVENKGSLSAPNARVDISIDGNIKKTVYVNVLSASKVNITPSLELESGTHILNIEINSDFNVIERNYLNNLKNEDIRIATIEADMIPSLISFDIGNTIVNISVPIQNKGGSNSENANVEFWIDNNLISTEKVNIGYNEIKIASIEWQKENGIYDVLIKVNPDHDILESNYSNNNISKILYVCSKSRILIVDDNDAQDYSTDTPSSSSTFETVLKNNSYCINIWNESENGVPNIDYLNQFDSVIWSAGDYWNTVINESDVALLEQYQKGIIFEGSDIAFDHKNDTFMQNHLHSQLESDMILDNITDIVIGTHEIFNNISHISINNSLSPYPDSLMATDGLSIANWSDINSAIIIYESTESRIVYYGFSVDAVTDAVVKENLILNSVEWATNLKDTIPPASIGNLTNITSAQNYINWTWTNPHDSDFSHVMIYLNGSFITNISAPQNYSNVTGLLADTSYELGTHTVDISGNINRTWINSTARTTLAGLVPIQVTNPIANPAVILNDNGRARPPGTNMTRLNITVIGDVANVTIDLSPIGGSTAALMTRIEGTDNFTIITNATSGINITNYLMVNATGTSGNFNNSVSVPLTVLLRGDIIRDNKIDLKDLLDLRRYLAGLEPSINPLVADIQTAEGDGNVDLKDLLYLRRYLANLEPLI